MVEKVSGEVDTDSNGNGHADKYPVTFGDLPNMVLTIEAASQMLTDLKREKPILFGDYLLRTYEIEASVNNKRKGK